MARLLVLLLWLAFHRSTHADLGASNYNIKCFPYIPLYPRPAILDCESAIQLFEDDIDFDFPRSFGALGAPGVQRALPARWARNTCEITFETRDDKNVETFTLSDMLPTIKNMTTDCLQRSRIGGWFYIGSTQGFYIMVQPNPRSGDISVTVPYNPNSGCQPWLSALSSGAVAKSPGAILNRTEISFPGDFCGIQSD